MTITEAPNEGESKVTNRIDELEQNFILVKKVHGTNVFVSPDNGKFYAKFAQTADVKWFDRPSLAQIESLITNAMYPFSGHVEVILRPNNLVEDHDIRDLEHGFLSDEELKEKGGYRTHKFTPERKTRVLTGVVRREYSYGQTRVLFKTESDGVQTMDEGYVQPRAYLDLLYFQAAKEYLENQTQWRARFQEIIDQYEPFHISQIVAALRAQGARTGRG